MLCKLIQVARSALGYASSITHAFLVPSKIQKCFKTHSWNMYEPIVWEHSHRKSLNPKSKFMKEKQWSNST